MELELLEQALRGAGMRGATTAELGELVGQCPAAVERGLASLARSGGALEWGRRWYAVDGTRWRAGRFVRRERRGGFVRCLPLSGGRRVSGRSAPLEELAVAERDRAGARDGDLVIVKLLRSRRRGGVRGRPGGAVVKIVERKRAALVGQLQRRSQRATPRVWAFLSEQATDARDVLVEGAEEIDDGVWVKLLLGDTRRDGTVCGVVDRVLGRLGEPGTDVAVVIEAHEIPDSLPEDAATEAARLPRAPAGQQRETRSDLRGAACVTIDGESARDFDDAIEVRRTRSGGFRARVHIADVAEYVAPGTAIDREARRRGTSVYFPERAVHMLPATLSEELCSLRPEVDRLALTVEMRFDRQGVRTGYTLLESVIRSRRRLTYRQAEALYRGAADRGDDASGMLPAPIERMLHDARELARLLLARRSERGALDFLLPAIEMQIDEAGSIVRVAPAERLEAHRVIEQLMIAANQTVAEELERATEELPWTRPLYRVHTAPRERDLEPLAAICRSVGIAAPEAGEAGVSPLELARVLAECRAAAVGPAAEQLVLRAMGRAIYSEEPDGHFALAAPHYCHFTSPIRRYPDLVNHRAVKALLRHRRGADASGLRDLENEPLAAHLSQRERVAESAERDLRKWKMVRYLADRIGTEWDGSVTGVEPFGLFVVLNDLGVDGLVRAETLLGDPVYSTERLELHDAETGRTFRLGDEIRVTIAAADVVGRRVDLVLASGESRPGARVRRRGRGSRGRPRRRSQHRAGRR